MTEVKERPERPPRDNLFRALRPAGELREEGDQPPVLTGYFTAFNQWTLIDSVFEGRFLEQIAPSAFEKTFAENRDAIRVLFNHGRDPQVGDKVLGPIDVLRVEEYGPYVEVPLFDTAYNREIIPGIRAKQYGQSFRFRIVKEQFENKPEASETNPQGVPERTILEADVMEFGPVTFPAYAGATAGIRSLTDEFIAEQFTHGEGLRKLAEVAREKREPEKTTPSPEPARTTPDLYQPTKRPSWAL